MTDKKVDKDNARSEPGKGDQRKGQEQPPYGQWSPGNYYPPPYYQYPPYYYHKKKQRSSKPGIAGGLMIVAGILGLLMAVGMILVSAVFGSLITGDWDGGDPIDFEGQVLDENTNGLEGVTVNLVGTDKSDVTDANGSFEFIAVTPGFYEIELEKGGYNHYYVKVLIGEDRDMQANGNNGGLMNPTDDLRYQMQPGSTEIRDSTYDEDAKEFMEAMMGRGFLVLGIFFIGCSIVAIIGGYFALQRTHFIIALLGAVFGILAIGVCLGAFLSLIALFVLVLSHREFKKKGENGNGANGGPC